ncbi:c-type cytochrome [Humitalea rosea]|nr:cytochrome c [Humitalea rosea]
MLGLALLLGAGGGAAWAQADVIAARKASMKRMSEQLEVMKPVMEARGDVSALATRVADIAEILASVPSRFPTGSDSGDTKARPTIWSDRAGFEKAAETTLAAAQTLRTAVQSGDASASAAAFQALGGSCVGCHRGYRSR